MEESLKKAPLAQAGPLHAVYRINRPVTALLRLFANRYPLRAEVADRLGVSKSALDGYLDGSLQTLPSDRFWKMIEDLRASGYTEADLLETVGADAWKEVLEFDQPETSPNAKEALLHELIESLAEGRLEMETKQPDLVADASRAFGNLCLALRAAMRHEAKEIKHRIPQHIARRDIDGALDDLNRFESSLYNYLMKLYRVDDALEKAKDENIIAHIRPYMKLKESIRDQIERFLDETGFAIYPEETITDKLHRKKVMEFFRWTLARRYSANAAYRVNEYIHHPGLGLGRVTRIVGRNRIQVQFEDDSYGEKEMAANLGGFVESVMAPQLLS